jgi:DNA-binding LacI/PurR family transcriptional regulator
MLLTSFGLRPIALALQAQQVTATFCPQDVTASGVIQWELAQEWRIILTEIAKLLGVLVIL